MEWLSYLQSNGLNILYAVGILVVGLLVAGLIKRRLRKKIRKKYKDPTVLLFLVNVSYVTLVLLVVISMLSRLGVPTASLITVLGAGSLAIGLSLKDSLSHVASGLMLIGLKPFAVGDTVDIGGVQGTVDQINLLNIRVKIGNGDFVFIPNGKVFNDKICTKGYKGTRRIDVEVGIGYESDIKQAKSLMLKLAASHEKTLKEPEPAILVKSLADSAVIICVKFWVMKGDYTSVMAEVTEAIKEHFDQAGISIPYPQIDAHIIRDAT